MVCECREGGGVCSHEAGVGVRLERCGVCRKEDRWGYGVCV